MIAMRARRRVVERSHRRMNRFRRILVSWDKQPEHSIAFLRFACALIARRAADRTAYFPCDRRCHNGG